MEAVKSSGRDRLVEDIERDLAQIERKVSELSERRAELSVELGQIVRDRDLQLRRLASLKRERSGE